MEKFKDWDDIEAKGNEDFKYLPLGAYECKIITAEEYESMSGNKSIKITVDIASGEFKDYFKDRFDGNDKSDKKWDNNATKYFGLAETGKAFFKGFITSVENSNAGFKFDFDESKLVGKKIACSFEPEEYSYEGKEGVKITINKIRSLDKLKDIKVGSIKLLNGKYMSYDDYQEQMDEVNKPLTKEDFPFDVNDEDLVL